ncbi:hypothetical protein ACLIOB_001191 [Vibrio cholerae]|uniref:hypothetical protein n=1 Tax=Vibrio cholerae TaxID=666 RepID=UPI002478688E|nr:hypothetical protein [Vibrio cholerae]MDH7614703.1 hypothetical protein [Vibrio cholerae]HDZ3692794.1 hypothetical protein [Vibrio cholerae]
MNLDQIINGKYVQTGLGLKTVRVIPRDSGKEAGFATTTYSFGMTEELKEYSAERIALAMRLLTGKTNEDIKVLIAHREHKARIKHEKQTR